MENDVEKKIDALTILVEKGFSAIAEDISEIKTDITEMKMDIVEMKTDITDMKTDIASVKEGLRSVDAKVAGIDKRLDIEAGIRDDIKIPTRVIDLEVNVFGTSRAPEFSTM